MLARLGCTLERIPQPLLQRGGLLLGGGQLGVVVLLLLQQGRGFQLAFQVLVSEELLLLALQGLHALPQLVVGVAAERCRGGGAHGTSCSCVTTHGQARQAACRAACIARTF